MQNNCVLTKNQYILYVDRFIVKFLVVSIITCTSFLSASLVSQPWHVFALKLYSAFVVKIAFLLFIHFYTFFPGFLMYRIVGNFRGCKFS